MTEHANSFASHRQRWRRMVLDQALTAAKERRAIASDLHDHVGQALALVKQKLFRLQGDLMFYGLDGQVGDIRRLIEEIIKYTRDLTAKISPPVLYELGLAPAIEWLAEKVAQEQSFRLSLQLPADRPDISSEAEETLFRSLREILANIGKHAEATEVAIRFCLEQGQWRLSVRDNGKGFAPEVLSGKALPKDGFGLFNIKVLMRSLGGSLELEPAIPRGSIVTLVIPRE